jgi:hypothetical protein
MAATHGGPKRRLERGTRKLIEVKSSTWMRLSPGLSPPVVTLQLAPPRSASE